MPTKQHNRERTPRLFKNSNYTLYFLGVLVSACGTILSQFATNLFLLELSGTASLMSWYMTMNILVTLVLTPFLGPLIDRLNKVRILYVCDFLFGLTDLLLAALLFSTSDQTLTLVGIFINGFANSISSSFYNPTSRCMVPLIVEEDEQVAAYSYLSSMQDILGVLGMLLAAGAFSLLGYRWILVINGVSFILSAFSELFIRLKEVPKAAAPTRFFDDFKFGFVYLGRQKILVTLITCGVLLNISLCGVIDVVLPYMLNVRLALAPIVFASGEAAFSVGSLLAALLIARSKGKGLGKAFIVGEVGFFLSYALISINYGMYAAARYILPVFVAAQLGAMLLSGFFLGRMNILSQACFSKYTEKQYLGRVSAVRSVAGQVSLPLAMLAFGWFTDRLGVGASLLIGTGTMLLCLLYTLSCKPLRTL